MKLSFASWMGVLAVSLAFGLVAGANAAEGQQTLDEMVSSASSAADHNAVAAAYDDEANELETKAATHEKLASVYKARGSTKGGADMGSHCDRIAQDLRQSAKLNREIAEHHRAMASGIH
jgi:hypothetical protein